MCLIDIILEGFDVKDIHALPTVFFEQGHRLDPREQMFLSRYNPPENGGWGCPFVGAQAGRENIPEDPITFRVEK